MLNKELLLTPSENLGTVTVTTAFLDELLAESRLYLFEFNGWDKPQGKVYAEFTKADAHIPKIVNIPIGTVVNVGIKPFGYTWFGAFEGFEEITTNHRSVLKLVDKTAKVALSGYYS